MDSVQSLNGDMSRSAVMQVDQMEWQASPSGTVFRKRFHLVGEPEAGQVTSLVRYAPGASFAIHDHPQGEEILVLEGIFTDHTGDWDAGSYLLNPQGFSHAPGSSDGCLIFVKLRQYQGNEHLAINSRDIEPEAADGYSRRQLASLGIEQTYLADLPAGVDIVRHQHQGMECFVVSGQLEVNGLSLGRYDWFRCAPEERTEWYSQGCTLYVKDGAVTQLWSA